MGRATKSTEIKILEREAMKHDLSISVLNHGHVQIKGGLLLVNYYPNSKNRTAYIGQTKKGVRHVSPIQAVQMAIEQPKMTGEKVKRKSRLKWKIKRLKKQPNCCWCNKPMHLDNSDDALYATTEHIVPLIRGGLDNYNNIKLACNECNGERGHNMANDASSTGTDGL